MIQITNLVNKIWWPSPAHKLVAMHLADNGTWPAAIRLDHIAHFANVTTQKALKIASLFYDGGLIVRTDTHGEGRLELDGEILYLLSTGGAQFRRDGRPIVNQKRLLELREQTAAHEIAFKEEKEERATQCRKRIIRLPLRRDIFKRDGHRCMACNSQDDLQIDHIFPIKHGGTSSPANLQTLCRSCNASKRDRIPAGAVKP